MNKKGFILSTYVYILLTFFLLILGTTLVVLNNTKMLAKKIKDESIQSSGMDAKFSIILQGEKEIEIFKDTTFTDPGYIAQTTKGEILEAVVNSNVDTSNAGDYVIIYTVTYNGETKRETRNVKVLNRVINFTFIESAQKFIVPQTGTYQIELWGASGKNIENSNGGKGGYTKGLIFLNADEKFYVFVGQQGITGTYGVDATSTKGKGGASTYNGGGAGGEAGGTQGTNLYSYYFGGSSGGGATDIRYFENYTPSSADLQWDSERGLKSRIMVAGAGGSNNIDYDYDSSKSNGGGLIGETGAIYAYFAIGYVAEYASYRGVGATQISGYQFGIGQTGPNSGIPSACDGFSGGGGGYYGGKAPASTSGYCYSFGGGGGSSFISGHDGCVAITLSGNARTDSTESTLCNSSSSSGYNASGYNVDSICSEHYSGKKFTDTLMIDGSGQKWEIIAGVLSKTSQAMPKPNGGFYDTGKGHTGDGYAKITYIGE